jgi:hypothetical protein
MRMLRILNFQSKFFYDLVPGSALGGNLLSRSLIEAMVRFERRDQARLSNSRPALRAVAHAKQGAMT